MNTANVQMSHLTEERNVAKERIQGCAGMAPEKAKGFADSQAVAAIITADACVAAQNAQTNI